VGFREKSGAVEAPKARGIFDTLVRLRLKTKRWRLLGPLFFFSTSHRCGQPHLSVARLSQPTQWPTNKASSFCVALKTEENPMRAGSSRITLSRMYQYCIIPSRPYHDEGQAVFLSSPNSLIFY
jgi:hypothetical protein